MENMHAKSQITSTHIKIILTGLLISLLLGSNGLVGRNLFFRRSGSIKVVSTLI